MFLKHGHTQKEKDFTELSAFHRLSLLNNVDTENLNFYASLVDASKLVQWLQKRLEDSLQL